MKLDSIVLTGFKSFAKREKIKMRDGILAVVGPNGCGKSNIVDALRWAMGESRASQLRQEVSSDIIFNGASANRAADWCSVELLLQNDGSRDLGMWSSYDDLSVRRQVERDGRSDYFINGQRVRRRDVHDLFADTGSGSRSYGIVEQERVTQIVRADPQLIRSHMEEVAGVAIYKNRRRESESKITVAEGNITRLEDQVRLLESQLRQLERQSALTVKIRKIKQQLEHLEALSLSMRLAKLSLEHGQAQAELSKAAAHHDDLRARSGEQEKGLATARKERQQASDVSNKRQGACYAAQADLERARLSLAEFETQTQRLQDELAEEGARLAEHAATEKSLLQTQDELNVMRLDLGKEQDAAASRQAASADELGKLTAQGRELREQLEHAEQKLANATKAEHELQALCDLHCHRIDDFAKNSESVQHDLGNLAEAIEPDEKGLEELRRQAAAAAQAAIKAERERQAKEAQLSDAKSDLLRIQGQIGGLKGEQGLLRSVSGHLKQENAAWFAEHGEQDAKRLMDIAGISAPGLEKAVDAALGSMLEGFFVSDLDHAIKDGRTPDGLVLLSEEELAKRPASSNIEAKLPTLAARVKTGAKCQDSIAGMLAGVFLADDYASARKASHHLRAGERIVTPDGEIFSSGMVMAARSAQAGLAWQAKLKDTEDKLSKLEHEALREQSQIENLSSELVVSAERSSKLATQREQVQKHFADAEQKALQQRHEASYRKQQSQRLDAALRQLFSDKSRHEQLMVKDKARLEVARKVLLGEQQEVAKLKASTGKVFDELEQLREQSDADTKALQQIQVDISVTSERLRDTATRLEESKQTQGRTSQSISEHRKLLQERNSRELVKQLEVHTSNLRKAEQALEQAELAGRKLDSSITDFEARMLGLRGKLENENARLRELEQTVTAKFTEMKMVGDSLEGRRIDEQEFAQLQKEHGDEEIVNQRMAALKLRIEKAGPINYAAEAEHKVCEERHNEMTLKNAELNTALAALQDAILRIDNEMLGRLKVVHSKLNVRFDALFKQLFGGGQASLHLDGDDLLSSGLSLRVTPPGKRVTHIQSLSGGEKTLTALAFLFALNDLNPMPFCVLDEVDAALDDTNTGHFLRLIESMKERTQFLLITHNKQVIERADWLLGVTQEERGITKMVSVNLEQALGQVELSASTGGKAVA